MKNLKDIKERYCKEPFNRRLGHLASDLLRISSFLDNPKNESAVAAIIEESKFFIEWAAPEASYEVLEFFAEIQPKLAFWQRRLSGSHRTAEVKKDLRKNAKEWSSRLLHFSGLLAA